jgi:hypothetical protein
VYLIAKSGFCNTLSHNNLVAVRESLEIFRDFSLITTLILRSETAFGWGWPPHPAFGRPLPNRGEVDRFTP